MIVTFFQLEEWWYETYLKCRTPLVPYVSMGAVDPRYLVDGSAQLCRVADFAHNMISYWLSLRKFVKIIKMQ